MTGAHEIVLQSSADFPRSGGSLLVGDLDSPNYKRWGYNWSTTWHLRHVRNWSTTWHLRHVRVPRELSIRKQAGQTTAVVLDHRADGSVEVTALR